MFCRSIQYLGTKFAHNSELPILVKLIDAEQNLSVQVHPDGWYAMKHEGQNGKTEMWYIVDAADDASIVYGFEHAVTKEYCRQLSRKALYPISCTELRLKRESATIFLQEQCMLLAPVV